ncbi:radical SAM protein [Candidatus Woesearchaeota archaeon]|nr:radical SAM protein [Candidatus Woesearchaeota archaeon]
MAEETVISFEDIRFVQEKGRVRGVFQQRYFFSLASDELAAIGAFTVEDGCIVFAEREKRAWNKFMPLLDKGLAALTHGVRNKPCVYIHKESGVPLVGSNEFGIIDRGTNVLEVKPLTGCNLSCSFCSVGEGENDKRDVLVQEEYLVEVFSQVARLKRHPVEANIGPQGEPLLYPRLVALVRDLKRRGAAVVSMNTNGTLLHERLIDALGEAGLDRINLSLHTFDQSLNDRLMGGVQDLRRLQEMIRYCAGKIDVLLTPVLLPGLNDHSLDELIVLAKGIKNRHWPSIGVQNFLHYPGGRNPGVKERSWEAFYALLREKERQHGIELTMKGNQRELFNICPDQSLPKPFRKGEVVTVTLRVPGRDKQEWLGDADERVVTVRECRDGKEEKRVKVRLLRDKHNIFAGVPA